MIVQYILEEIESLFPKDEKLQGRLLKLDRVQHPRDWFCDFRPRRLPCETHSRENESACSFVGTTSERSTTAATTNRQYFWERGGINCNTRRDWLELTIVYSYRCYPLISVTITEYLPTVKVFVSSSRRVKERALDEETAIRYYLTCSKVRESASLLPKPVKQDCSRGFHLSVSFTLVLHEKILLSLR